MQVNEQRSYSLGDGKVKAGIVIHSLWLEWLFKYVLIRLTRARLITDERRRWDCQLRNNKNKNMSRLQHASYFRIYLNQSHILLLTHVMHRTGLLGAFCPRFMPKISSTLRSLRKDSHLDLTTLFMSLILHIYCFWLSDKNSIYSLKYDLPFVFQQVSVGTKWWWIYDGAKLEESLKIIIKNAVPIQLSTVLSQFMWFCTQWRFV